MASFAKQLGVYILRPPEHSPVLLANAQMRWLPTDNGSTGWRRLPDVATAQQERQPGQPGGRRLRESPTATGRSRIAFIRPGRPGAARLASDGPEVTQAGATNAIASLPLRRAFSHHRGAWPDDIRYFEHAIAWSS